MDEIIALVGRLVDRGLAYPVEGDVYFRVRAFAAYGRLSKRNLDELKAGARVDVDERKEDPLDFALWKAAKPGEPAWSSPWGAGRPGWHIECSAMCERHLGLTFDIHCGGRDLVFPHHENEIAQSRGAYGDETFARYWLHNGFVNFAGEKMSKSLGNFFTIREVVEIYEPEALRWFLLAVHYRSPLNFDVLVRCRGCQVELSEPDQARGRCSACGREADAAALRAGVCFPGLDEAEDRLAYVYESLGGAAAALGPATPASEPGEVLPAVGGMGAAVRAALADDLNTAAALAALSEPLAEVNRLLGPRHGVEAGLRQRTLARFLLEMRGRGEGRDPQGGGIAGILGLFGAEPEAWLLARRGRKARRRGLDTDVVERLVQERWAARTRKDWETADRLRDELGSRGVIVRDGPTGSKWAL
jgi:cysteinyl-tRNA synthetase